MHLTEIGNPGPPGSYRLLQGSHRVAYELEVEGYEVQDCIHVITVDGVEQWWLTRRPPKGPIAHTVQTFSTGALNLGACRIPSDDRVITTHSRGTNQAFPKRPTETTPEQSGRHKRQDLVDEDPRYSRWPSNVVFVHAEGCQEAPACLPDCPVRLLDIEDPNREVFRFFPVFATRNQCLEWLATLLKCPKP